MTSAELLLHIEAYVGLRQALGYTVRSNDKLLKDFVAFLESHHNPRTDSRPARSRVGLFASARTRTIGSSHAVESCPWLPGASPSHVVGDGSARSRQVSFQG